MITKIIPTLNFNLVFVIELACVKHLYALLTHVQKHQSGQLVNSGPVTIWLDSEEL